MSRLRLFGGSPVEATLKKLVVFVIRFSGHKNRDLIRHLCNTVNIMWRCDPSDIESPPDPPCSSSCDNAGATPGARRRGDPDRAARPCRSATVSAASAVDGGGRGECRCPRHGAGAFRSLVHSEVLGSLAPGSDAAWVALRAAGDLADVGLAVETCTDKAQALPPALPPAGPPPEGGSAEHCCRSCPFHFGIDEDEITRCLEGLRAAQSPAGEACRSDEW